MKEFEEWGLADLLAAKKLSTSNLMNFTRLWFQLMQSEKFRVNWHHHFFAI